MDKSFVYYHNNQEYVVNITYKRIKNIHYRFKDGAFEVSCPRLVTIGKIKSGLDRFAESLIKRSTKKAPEGDNYIYLLGNKITLTYPGCLFFLNERIAYETKEQLHRKLKKVFLSYLINRTREYEKIMKAPSYQIKIRDMKTRYGSNNRPKKVITYAFMLIYHPQDVIDSVVVHELTHCFVYDHSDKFYRLLYKYCPNYDILRKRLIKAVFD